MTTQETGITKEDLTSFKEEIIQQFHVSTEGIRDEVRRLAEGVARVNEKLDNIHKELTTESRKRGRKFWQQLNSLMQNSINV